MTKIVKNGIDNIASVDALLKGKRLGLITNPTGVCKDMTATIDILNEKYNLTALYSPEHGVRGDAQAGVHISDVVDPLTGVMAYSLYGHGDQLNADNTKDVDMIVMDILAKFLLDLRQKGKISETVFQKVARENAIRLLGL